MPKFKALTDGTMSNPYRQVYKDDVVDLTDDEAKFYAKSKWLRPEKEVNAIKPMPLMPHMKIVGGESVGPFAGVPDYSRPDPKLAKETSQLGSANYNTQIKALKAAENVRDGRTEKVQEGTGNIDPLA